MITKTYPGADGIVTCFVIYGVVYFLGVGLWLMIDASKPIDTAA